MPKIGIHIKNFRRIALVWFLLFSLSSCIVKKVLFHAVNVNYEKPLNKSRTTAPTSICSYLENDKRQVSVAKISKESEEITTVIFFSHLYFATHTAKFHIDYSKTFSGSSPPKYILYKRLKIDVV